MFSEKWLEQIPLEQEDSFRLFRRRRKPHQSSQNSDDTADSNADSKATRTKELTSQSIMFSSSSTISYFQTNLGKRKRHDVVRGKMKEGDEAEVTDAARTRRDSRPRRKSLRALLMGWESDAPSPSSRIDNDDGTPTELMNSALFSGLQATNGTGNSASPTTQPLTRTASTGSSHGVAVIHTPRLARSGSQLMSELGETTPPLPGYVVELLGDFETNPRDTTPMTNVTRGASRMQEERPRVNGNGSHRLRFQTLRRGNKARPNATHTEDEGELPTRDWFADPAPVASVAERRGRRGGTLSGVKRRLSLWRV